jgi:hypothetical protein
MSTNTACRILFATLAAAALSCAPKYESGVTRCSAGECPAGFKCVKAVCYLPGDVPSGAGGGGGAPPVNTGGAGGTGGTKVDASVRGQEAGTPTGVTPDSCRDPKPQFCAARGAIPAACQEDWVDCSTSTQCPDGVRGCGTGYKVDCRYRFDYCQATQACSDMPVYSASCPAMGDIGPSCATPDADCSSRKICGSETETRLCRGGEKVDCNYDYDYCQPPKCDADRPQTCPAKDKIGPGCWRMTTDCSTRTVCAAGDVRACRSGQKVDCQYEVDSCVPSEVCSGDYPVSCPPMGKFGPGCWGAGSDCSTRTLCEDGSFAICEAGQKVDCRYKVDACLPPKPCGGDFPVSCPAMGVFGPGCWPAGTDCASRTLCGDEVRSCSTGLKVDCQYKQDYCLGPVNGCNTPTDVRCPPMGDLGPRCTGMLAPGRTLDCAGRIVCPDETTSTVCYTGAHVDCSKPPGQRCVLEGSGGAPDAGADASRG